MNSTTAQRFLRPAATIIENNDGFVIEADMPGVQREGLELTVEDDSLTILGKRGDTKINGRAIHRESASLNYRRAFELGREINRSGVTAQFNQGVLRIFLPKAEEVKPRRVEIAG